MGDIHEKEEELFLTLATEAFLDSVFCVVCSRADVVFFF